MRKFRIKGQSLIEIVAAIGILSIILTSITIASITALSNSEYTKEADTASRLGQEVMEDLRQIRNNDVSSFRKYEGNYCWYKGQTSLGASSDCLSPNTGEFIRSVRIKQDGCGTDVARVEVNVLWTDGRCENGTFCHKSQLDSCFSVKVPSL